MEGSFGVCLMEEISHHLGNRHSRTQWQHGIQWHLTEACILNEMRNVTQATGSLGRFRHTNQSFWEGLLQKVTGDDRCFFLELFCWMIMYCCVIIYTNQSKSYPCSHAFFASLNRSAILLQRSNKDPHFLGMLKDWLVVLPKLMAITTAPSITESQEWLGFSSVHLGVGVTTAVHCRRQTVGWHVH